MDPIKAIGRTNIFGNFIGRIDGGVEVLDDLNDHWTAKNHKTERKHLIEDLQDLAAEKSVRITILRYAFLIALVSCLEDVLIFPSGDVHLAAIGQFYSNPKLGVPKDRDFRYMPNVISSAIVNTPPPNALADILNRRERVHHFDEDTDENMIPRFDHDVNGAKRNNKRLLPRRNWCSIREYNPTLTPPPTPPDERSPSPPPRTSLLRRLSTSRGPSYRPDAGPPPSSGMMRNFSVRGRTSTDSERTGIRQRALSLTRRDFLPANLFRRGPKRRPDDGGINGYGADSDEDDIPDQDLHPPKLRGGAGDDSYFPPDAAAPFTRTRVSRNAVIQGHDDGYASYDDESPDQQTHSHHRSAPVLEPARRPFHRTPTGLTEKQIRRLGADHEVNLEGGLDICLNVEISQKDPAGSTETYRLLVPALWYEDTKSNQGPVEKKGTGFKRLMSLGRVKTVKPAWKGKGREDDYDDEDYNGR
jgi:PhoD related phosphatase